MVSTRKQSSNSAAAFCLNRSFYSASRVFICTISFWSSSSTESIKFTIIKAVIRGFGVLGFWGFGVKVRVSVRVRVRIRIRVRVRVRIRVRVRVRVRV